MHQYHFLASGAVEDSATLEEIGEVSLKGLSQAVAVFKMIL